MPYITAERFHDFSCGHRVHGHEGACRHLHGHNYRIHFVVEGWDLGLDALGRVLDFSVIKAKLCEWLEDNWDHRMLMWQEDPLAHRLVELDPESIVLVPFNPTAENMAKHLLMRVGPVQLEGTGVKLIECKIEETRKCSATASL
jgi:6-pyruvoyltetrahydropterin/6-carboxytetrahydropterin synthase